MAGDEEIRRRYRQALSNMIALVESHWQQMYESRRFSDCSSWSHLSIGASPFTDSSIGAPDQVELCGAFKMPDDSSWVHLRSGDTDLPMELVSGSWQWRRQLPADWESATLMSPEELSMTTPPC